MDPIVAWILEFKPFQLFLAIVFIGCFGIHITKLITDSREAAGEFQDDHEASQKILQTVARRRRRYVDEEDEDDD